jgi:hypothetical protein
MVSTTAAVAVGSIRELALRRGAEGIEVAVVASIIPPSPKVAPARYSLVHQDLGSPVLTTKLPVRPSVATRPRSCPLLRERLLAVWVSRKARGIAGRAALPEGSTVSWVTLPTAVVVVVASGAETAEMAAAAAAAVLVAVARGAAVVVEARVAVVPPPKLASSCCWAERAKSPAGLGSDAGPC